MDRVLWKVSRRSRSNQFGLLDDENRNTGLVSSRVMSRLETKSNRGSRSNPSRNRYMPTKYGSYFRPITDERNTRRQNRSNRILVSKYCVNHAILYIHYAYDITESVSRHNEICFLCSLLNHS